jgi:hypothetical protein
MGVLDQRRRVTLVVAAAAAAACSRAAATLPVPPEAGILENSVFFHSESRGMAYLWPQPMSGWAQPAYPYWCDYGLASFPAILAQRFPAGGGLAAWDNASAVTQIPLWPARGLVFWSNQVRRGAGEGGGGCVATLSTAVSSGA